MSKTSEFSSINTNAERDSQHVQRVGDLISRAALFNSLANVKTLEEAFAVIQGMPEAKRYTDGEVEKMQELEAAEIQMAYELGREEGKPRWIPCAEAEPEEDQECWVTVKTTDTIYRGDFTRRYGERRDKGFITTGGFMWWNTALAWMPIIIPEPWKGEE